MLCYHLDHFIIKLKISQCQITLKKQSLSKSAKAFKKNGHFFPPDSMITLPASYMSDIYNRFFIMFEYILQFAYAQILMVSIPLLALIAIYRIWFYQPVTYKYPLSGYLKDRIFSVSLPLGVLNTLRFLSLLILALLVAKPQLVDTRSKIPVQGRDIMLALDVSGSMAFVDDPSNPKRRIDVAKKEALRFVKRRVNDSIGLVLFGRESVVRAPLTLDKNILSSVIKELELGIVDERATVLAKGLAMAARRLRDSTAKSKVIILLTDGAPSDEDIDPNQAIAIAQHYGIKVYTIGIGSDTGGYQQHPFFGWQPIGLGGAMNRPLLKEIAKQTGGQFFEAKNPAQMAKIYDTIDALETTKQEVDVYSKYFDVFESFIWIVLALLFCELVLAAFKWVVI